MPCQLKQAIKLLQKTPAAKKHINRVLNNSKIMEDKYSTLTKKATGKEPNEASVTDFSNGLSKLIKDTTRVKITNTANFTLEQIHAGMVKFIPARFSTKDGIEVADVIDSEAINKLSVDFYTKVVEGTLPGIAKITTEAQLNERLADEVADMFEVIKFVKGSHFLAHELIHAGAYEYMSTNPNEKATKRIEEIYTYLMNNYKDLGVTEGYWQTNVDEFTAEALSNPRLIKELMAIQPAKPIKRLSNLYEVVLATALEMVGLRGSELTNIFDIVLDANLKILEETSTQQKAQEGTSKKPTNTPTEPKVTPEVKEAKEVVKEAEKAPTTDSTSLAANGSGKYNMGIKEYMINYIRSKPAIQIKLKELGVDLKDC